MVDNIILLAIATFVVSLILIVITFSTVKKKQTKKYKKEIEYLDVEKNKLIGIPILSEISKVRELVKTDNLKAKLDDWDNTFKVIKDEKVPEVNDMISEVDFLIDRKDYKNAIKKIADIEIEINTLKRKSDNLLNEIKLVTQSEERNRSIITKLKMLYREMTNKYERTKKDYGEVGTSIENEFVSIEKKFHEFEKAMDLNDYVEVEKIVLVLEEMINRMKEILDRVPSLVLMSTVLIPSSIDQVMLSYSRMLRDGYPLDYLNVEYNINEIRTKISNIMDSLKNLELGESEIELKTIMDYFNNLFNDFDKEKESKDIFRENIKILKSKIEKVNRIVYDIYIQIDDIKLNYNLSDEEINKFSVLNKNLEKINQDYKILVDQGRGKTFAYSKLVDELNGLSTRLSRLQDDLDYQLHSITSMKDDESRAREQLEVIEKLLKQSKMKLKEYRIPVIPNSYFIELSEASEALREIAKELDKKPIVIKILNIRVDTARDLVFKIYNKTNDLVKSVIYSERLIVYGNRYRSTYTEIDKMLTEAEMLFNKGQYKKTLDMLVRELQKIDTNVLERLEIEI